MGMDAYINIAVQLFGAAISLMIIVFLRFVRRNQSKLDRLYIRFLLCNTIVLITNSLGWIYDGQQGIIGYYGATLSNFFMFVFSFLLIGVFTDYFVAYLSQKSVQHYKIARRIVWSFMTIAIITVVISVFNQMYYTINSQNVYSRGKFFWLSQVLGIIGTAVNLWLLLYSKKKLTKKEFIAFLAYLIVPIVALIMQIFFYGLISLHIATTFVAISIYVFIQAEQTRMLDKAELELEKSRMSIMVSQIQPHFLRNCLICIQQLCEIQPKKASDALSCFSLYLRSNLDSISDTGPVLFTKEMEHVENYLYLEKLRFEEKLCIVWDIGIKDFVLPALTLQPLVENAVRHGVTKKQEGGTVIIKTREEKNTVIITVLDNGLGFDTKQTYGSEHIGIQNVRNRIETLCGGTLNIQSILGVGTTVTLTVSK